MATPQFGKPRDETIAGFMELPDDLETREYYWESGYERTWETIKGDDDASKAHKKLIEKTRKMRREAKLHQRMFGVMRHLYILIDTSETMALTDLRPTRLIVTVKLLKEFIKEFLNMNPLSRIGLIILKNGEANKAVPLCSDYDPFEDIFDGILKDDDESTVAPSLLNGIKAALSDLVELPLHTSREIVTIMTSLTTCDSSSPETLIDEMCEKNIRCSILTLSADIYVCRKMAQATCGDSSCILNEEHYREQLMSYIDPPSAFKKVVGALIEMGFPHSKANEKEELLSMCACHLNKPGEEHVISTKGYFCPKCNNKYCYLPVECKVCNMYLVSAPHLVRSYHHIFPLEMFDELPITPGSFCYSCQDQLDKEDTKAHRCSNCRQIFCSDCNGFMHDVLHTCVGCTSNSSLAAKKSKPRNAGTSTRT